MIKTETKSYMFNANFTNEVNGLIVGEKSLHEELKSKNYIPTTVRKIIEDKVEKDLNTIKEAIELMKFYKFNGVDDFDYDLDIILNKIK